jgi:hypothetical protein
MNLKALDRNVPIREGRGEDAAEGLIWAAGPPSESRGRATRDCGILEKGAAEVKRKVG